MTGVETETFETIAHFLIWSLRSAAASDRLQLLNQAKCRPILSRTGPPDYIIVW